MVALQKALARIGWEIEADGAIFTGGFVPEATLMRMAHLQVDAGSGGPATGMKVHSSPRSRETW